MRKFNSQPTLENSSVIIRPLQETDFEGLYSVASDAEIWEQHPAKERSEREGFKKFFEEAMAMNSAFLILDKETGEIIGTSRYNLCKESEKAVEIGWTFLAKKFWGGKYNRAIKALMVGHALKNFELVLFYIDENNLRSQKAVEKIGGKKMTSIDGKTLKTRPTASVIYGLDKSDFERFLQ